MEYTMYILLAAIIFSVVGFLAGKGLISFRSSAVLIFLLIIATPLLLNLFIWFYSGMTEEVFTPDVMGLDSETAISKLEKAHLKGEIVGVSFSDQSEGAVISQRPEGGKKVKSGRTISLVISAKEKMITVPNIVGMSKENATSFITSLGLNVGQINEVSTNEAAGTVVYQTPMASESVIRGTLVSISVSTGK